MEREYVLGTNDEEVERLGLQHRVWRPRVSMAWRKAGFTVGQTLLDVGAGPGYATRDLADIVGPTGTVWALERSRRYLDLVRAEERPNVRAVEIDLVDDAFPDIRADGAWIRWVLCFVKDPREVVRKVARCMKPGGRLVIHEYFAYKTWRMAPPCQALDEFVDAVIASWRADGGEPDIALELPAWLMDEGFTIDEALPIVETATVGSYVQQWPRSFLRTGLQRLVDLGHVQRDRAPGIRAELDARLEDPRTLLFTPAVLEIRATKGER